MINDRIMKGKVFASLFAACLPWLVMAQSNDDLYFVPKKEKKTETVVKVKTAPEKVSNKTTVYAAPGSTVVVKDAAGKTRDVDEYNRRYTSRDNTFSIDEEGTLTIQEKPYSERGEWVNGFDGSQDDYEYAMRIVRFRSPRYAIPVSSPLYWDVVYGAYPSWYWNVYDDGMYAYVFPTFSNPLWWDWRWSWGVSGPYCGPSWGWSSPWYYSSWHYPYWYGNYWGGYWGGYWGPHWHHHHYYAGGHWGGWRPYGHRDFRPSRYAGYSSSRRNAVASGTRGSAIRNGSAMRRGNSTTSVRRNTAATRSGTGRVVNPNSRNNGYSIRPVNSLPGNRGETTRSTTTRRANSSYVRPSSTIDRTGSSYNRPSSTRRSYNNVYNRNVNSTRTRGNSTGVNRNFNTNRNNFSTGSRSSFNRGSMGGGSSRMRSTGGGGGSRRR